MILCARSMLRARNADQAARTCKRPVVKMTRCYDYQTWPTHFWRNSSGAQRYVGLFCFSGADWLGEQTLITWWRP